MVSEFMLQQTPVERVLPKWHEWMARWPSPDDLASEPASAAVAAWGRLGYPRRAQRLHACALAIATDYDGIVPNSYEALIGLPGVGDYTAAAIATFAYKGVYPVLDTNIRRVFARVRDGQQYPSLSLTKAERERANLWALEAETGGAGRAMRWAASSMELGQVVCASEKPSCEICPISTECAWRDAGYPSRIQPKRTQAWKGTDRQCRGHLLDIVRHRDQVHVEVLLDAWPDRDQASRCVDSLLTDKLIQANGSTVTL